MTARVRMRWRAPAILVAWCALLAWPGTSRAQETWEPYGLSGTHPSGVQTDGTYLYTVVEASLATPFTELHRRYLDHPDSSWVHLPGLDGLAIFSLWATPLDPGVLLAGNLGPGSTPGSSSVYRSTDAGLTWTPVQTGMATDLSSHPGVALIVGSLLDPTFVVAWAGTFFRSFDRGLTWACGGGFGCSDLIGGPSAMIAPDPLVRERVWLPFAGAFETSYLYRSDDFGWSWAVLEEAPFTGTSAFTIDPRSGRIYRAVGDRVQISDDVGASWETVLDAGGGWLVTFALSPVNEMDVLLGGARVETGDVLVWTSRDGGASWSPLETGLPETIGAVWELVADPVHAGVYLASTGWDFNGEGEPAGMWRIELTDVVDVPSAPAGPPSMTVQANPASNDVHIEIAGGRAGVESVRIVDAAGRLVGTARRAGSSATYRWDGRDLGGRLAAPGIYFATLDVKGGPPTVRFVWLGR